MTKYLVSAYHKSAHTLKIYGMRLVLTLILISTAQMSFALYGSELEKNMLSVVDLLQHKKIQQALTSLDLIISQYPKYNLPRLIKADLLAKLSGQEAVFNARQERKLSRIRKEMVARWQSTVQDKKTDVSAKLPAEAIFLDAHYAYFIVVDVKKYRLYLFANNQDDGIQLIQTSYVTLGSNGYGKQREGDRKTPLGTYFINGVIPGEMLNPVRFGAADALPIDYPNAIDRMRGRTGYGIWFHGTRSTDQFRPPNASNGCVSLSDHEMQQLTDKLRGHTVPVIISDNVSWVKRQTWLSLRKQFFALLADFKHAHEMQNYDALAKLYVTKPTRTFTNKTVALRLRFDKIAILYNKHDDVLLTAFEFDDGLATTFKRIYWEQAADGWQIVREINTDLPSARDTTPALASR